MELDPVYLRMAQPTLFDLGDMATGAVELFPAVWNAMEALTNPEPSARLAGLERLEELDAQRLSPLVVYLLATRIEDTDLRVRRRAIQLLAGVLKKDKQGNLAPEAVRTRLNNYLRSMRTRRIFAILQVVVNDRELEEPAALLMNACPYGGSHLGNLLTDRKLPVPVRKLAARMIGRVGYLDVLPTLERLANRLEARLSGQQTMPFVKVNEDDEAILLPEIRQALHLLQAP